MPAQKTIKSIDIYIGISPTQKNKKGMGMYKCKPFARPYIMIPLRQQDSKEESENTRNAHSECEEDADIGARG